MLLARPGQRRQRAAVPVAVAAVALLAACWLFWNFEVKLVIKPRDVSTQHSAPVQHKTPQPAAAVTAPATAPVPVQAARPIKGVKEDQVLGSYAETLEPIAHAIRAVLGAKAQPGHVRSAYTKALQQYSLVGSFTEAPNPYMAAEAEAAGNAAASAAAYTLMTEGLRLIAANGRVVPCAMDATLPLNITASGRFLLAANLFQCDHMMANYVLQLMRVAVLFPQGALAVSIYESGSTDHTADWVDLLRLLLLPLGVTATITPRGSLTKQHNQERIEFLAVVRNAAIEPYFPSPQHHKQQNCRSNAAALTPGCFRPAWVLFLNDVQLCPSDVLRLMQYDDADMACGFDFYEPARRKHQRRSLQREQQHQLQPHWGQLQQPQQTEAGDDDTWLEQQQEEEQHHMRLLQQQSIHGADLLQRMDVVSSDTVWPEGQHLQQLMQEVHVSAASMASINSTTAVRRNAPTPQRAVQRSLRRPAAAQAAQPESATASINGNLAMQQRRDQRLQQRSRLRRALHAAQAVKPEERFLFLFWDIWVGRDVAGSKFGGGSPYIVHAPTAKRAMAGLPFQVYCCWNGMVKLNPEPFKRGLRFRTAQPGECRASECSLMCDDFHRMGFSRAVVDPNVRLAYTLELKTKAYKNFPHLANTTWAQASAAPHWHQQKFLNYSTIECCDLQPGAHYVDYAKDCRAYDVVATNFTAQVLPVQQQIGGSRGILAAGWAGQRRSWTGLAVLLAGALIVGGFAAWLQYAQ